MQLLSSIYPIRRCVSGMIRPTDYIAIAEAVANYEWEYECVGQRRARFGRDVMGCGIKEEE